MSGHLILSCFPGLDLLGLAFELEWPDACVVQGPDVIWGRDIRRHHVPAGRFDGIIGGPPCQPFSRLVNIVRANGYEPRHTNLIPEFERVIDDAQPVWFLMEEAEDAPLPQVTGYIVRATMLNNRWVGGEQNRRRRFSLGTRNGLALLPDVTLFECREWSPAVTASTGGGRINAKKKPGDVKNALRLQGLPEDFLDESPYTAKGKIHVIGNGVPIPLGRAIARAVRRALGLPILDVEVTA